MTVQATTRAFRPDFKAAAVKAATVLALGFLFVASAGRPASADAVADFYKGRTVDLIVGFSTGGGYDVYARLVGRHIGKHIPGNPTVVVKNMEGAGSMRLANWLYAVAPKDGSVFGSFARGVPLDPLFGNPGPQFKDGSKFSFIGSANDEVSICGASRKAGVNSFDDLLTKELVVGGFGAGTESEQHVKLLNVALNTKLKLVKGYPGGNDVNLAMERGEVQGRCGWSWTGVRAQYMDRVKDGSLVVLVQNSLAKHADLPDVPLIMDLAKGEDEKQMLRLVLGPQKMGRPFMGPPDLPADRLAALRRAFEQTMKDPEFLREAEKAQLEISPISGDEMEKIIADAYKTSPDLVKRTAEAIK
jgi:tripartite-type tricarboxylate transporter receptor subunit TctC